MCIQNGVSCSNKCAVINESGGKFALAFSNVDQICIIEGVGKGLKLSAFSTINL